MATSVTVNGRRKTKPGVYSKIDASGLVVPGAASTGVVAFVGEAVGGGAPVADISDAKNLLATTNPSSISRLFVNADSDLPTAAKFGFAPSKHPDIPGGVQTAIFCKVNPATQSTATLSNTLGTAIALTSEEYGAFTETISTEWSNATSTATVAYDGDSASLAIPTESYMDVNYLPPSGNGGWETMKAYQLSTGFVAYGSRDDAGLITGIANQLSGTQLVTVAASSGNDGKVITLYGTDGSGNAQFEAITVSGTVAVSSTLQFGAIYGATLSTVAATSTVVVNPTTGTSPVLTIAVAAEAVAAVKVSDMWVGNAKPVVDLTGTPGATSVVMLYGKSSANANLLNKFSFATATSTASAEAASAMKQVDVVVLGGLAVAGVANVSAKAVDASTAKYPTISKLVEHISSKSTGTTGFFATQVTGNSAFDVSLLDLSQDMGSDCYNSVTASFYAKLNSLVDLYNNSLSYIDAERIAFVSKKVDFTVTTTATLTSTTINGVTITSPASVGTQTQLAADQVARINRDRQTRYVVFAEVTSGATFRLTALTPAGFTSSSVNSTSASIATTAGVGGVPSTTTAPIFLSGGAEGTASQSDWQKAFDLLKQIRVNSIIPLTGDPSVHAALAEHLAYMNGAGANERDGLVGLCALDGNDEPTGELVTKTSAKAQIVDLNTRHIRACLSEIKKFDAVGTATWYAPWFGAAMAAGAQAGSEVGTSLTNKTFDVLDIRQDSSWNPADDGDEMIDAGAWFMETGDDGLIRCVRNVTTYLEDNNLAYIEASMNQIIGIGIYELRQVLKPFVGKKGFPGVVASAKARCLAQLADQKKRGLWASFKEPVMEFGNDTLEVAIEAAPASPINFIVPTLFLVPVTFSV